MNEYSRRSFVVGSLMTLGTLALSGVPEAYSATYNGVEVKSSDLNRALAEGNGSLRVTDCRIDHDEPLNLPRSFDVQIHGCHIDFRPDVLAMTFLNKPESKGTVHFVGNVINFSPENGPRHRARVLGELLALPKRTSGVW